MRTQRSAVGVPVRVRLHCSPWRGTALVPAGVNLVLLGLIVGRDPQDVRLWLVLLAVALTLVAFVRLLVVPGATLTVDGVELYRSLRPLRPRRVPWPDLIGVTLESESGRDVIVLWTADRRIRLRRLASSGFGRGRRRVAEQAELIRTWWQAGRGGNWRPPTPALADAPGRYAAATGQLGGLTIPAAVAAPAYPWPQAAPNPWAARDGNPWAAPEGDG